MANRMQYRKKSSRNSVHLREERLKQRAIPGLEDEDSRITKVEVVVGVFNYFPLTAIW